MSGCPAAAPDRAPAYACRYSVGIETLGILPLVPVQAVESAHGSAPVRTRLAEPGRLADGPAVGAAAELQRHGFPAECGEEMKDYVAVVEIGSCSSHVVSSRMLNCQRQKWVVSVIECQADSIIHAIKLKIYKLLMKGVLRKYIK